MSAYGVYGDAMRPWNEDARKRRFGSSIS